MINPEVTNIDAIAIHHVGNKNNNEGIKISKSLLKTNDSINDLLITFFFSPFKSKEFYNFYHEADLQMNEVYNFVSSVFNNPENLYEQSINIARHLYNQSTHPKIKQGELYVVYLQDCLIEDEPVDAIGIFKSENLETYLKVYPKGDGYEIDSDNGININKLDKGCIIFNSEAENGYLVAVADNLKKSSDAQYWKDDFLKIVPRTDDYYYTNNAIELCKEFVVEKLPENFEVSRVDQADMLNKSAKFFKENNNFGLEEFADEIFQQPDVIDSFKTFKGEFEEKNNTQIEDEFGISKSAVKKNARFFKSVIKLDKNFHIYVHGKREYIVRGNDPASGLNYYQLFFNDES